MFKVGEYYLEKLKTGKLTFSDNGIPSVSPLRHGAIYCFAKQSTVAQLQMVKSEPAEGLMPDTTYFRLFKAPVPTFNSLAELEQPVFVTECFFEIPNKEFSDIVTGNISELRESFPLALHPFFDASKEDLWQRVLQASSQAGATLKAG